MPAKREAPRCGNCDWYHGPRHIDSAIAARAAEAGHVIRAPCTRFPEAVNKGPDDLCGEHPVFAVERQAALAVEIARNLAAALEPPLIVAGDHELEREQLGEC